MNRSIITGERMVPVLYTDIDGTIRHGKDELGHYVNEAKDVRVFDGVPELLWGYKDLGYRIVGISNQGGITLGHLTREDCQRAMDRTNMQSLNAFDKMSWCSHHPNANNPEMAVCWCRKPKTGMVIEAAFIMSALFDEIYPPHLGVFIGDRPEDAECAKAAGLKFIDAQTWRTGEHLFEMQLESRLNAPKSLG